MRVSTNWWCSCELDNRERHGRRSCAWEMKQEICRGVFAVYTLTVLINTRYSLCCGTFQTSEQKLTHLEFLTILWWDPKHRIFRGSHIIPLKIYYNKELCDWTLLTECESENHQHVFRNITESMCNINVSRFQCATFSMLCTHSV